jgi:hypothetical protein
VSAAQLSLADTIPVIKRCLCGASYTDETWKALRYVGLQDLGDGELAELRDCTCSSTLAIELPPTDGAPPCR